jgi:PAS domain S-box-containing protein
MFGVTEKHVQGQPIACLIPQPHFFQQTVQLGSGTVTANGRRGDDVLFPIELSVNSMEVDGCKQSVAIIRDITERRRGEETLRHISLGVSAATGDEFVKSLVQQLSRALQSDFAFIVENAGSSATSTLTLSEKGEMHSAGSFDLTHTACAVVLQDGFRACLQGARAEFPDDGLLAGLEIESFIAMPLVDHHGRAVGAMGVLGRTPTENVQIIESTLRIFAARAAAELERKHFAEDLAAEKDRLAVTLRSIGDGCITIDREGRVLLLNSVAERLTGWTQDLAAGVPLVVLFRVLNERTRQPCQTAIQHLIDTGSAEELRGPTLIVAPDGSERLIETNAAPIRDGSNRHAGAVLVFRDVTERQRADEERRKAEKLESLGVAAGGIAHDFNNLLTAILGNLSLALFNPDLEPAVAERLTAAKKASLRAQELAGQLLTFAKGGAPIKQAASIAQLVRDTVSFSLRGTNVRSEVDIPEDLWAAEIDAGQISQVISNLTINAEQAMPAGGTLRVACANFKLANDNHRLGLTAGQYVKITVQDEGIGIPEENIKKIFDPYFTTKPKGSGLGLATSYSIIKSHNGVLDVVSIPGEGTTFYLFLAASDKPVVSVEAALPEVPAAGGSARVLVLDDEEAICALVTCALEPLGYEVTETNDALTAIRTYAEAMDSGRRFDLVISDLTIPGGMGGQEAVRRLRELDPSVKAIVSSGYAGDPIMSRFREHGFCGMIAKPYEIDALGRIVAEVLAAPPENVVTLDFNQRKTA